MLQVCKCLIWELQSWLILLICKQVGFTENQLKYLSNNILVAQLLDGNINGSH